MRRIWLGGDDLEPDFAVSELGASDHIKLVPPDPETGRVELPPPDGPRPTMRDYTIRRFDPVTKELALDFVLHSHGPAGRWAIDAVPGAEVGVLGPRGSQIFPGHVSDYLIVVDETGLPAAERFLEELPAEVAVRVIVLGGSQRPLGSSAGSLGSSSRPLGSLPLGSSPGSLGSSSRPFGDEGRAKITWLPDAAGLLDTVGDVPSDVFVWAAGEADVMRGLRAYLRDEQRVEPGRVSIHGYWRVGVAGALPRDEEA